MRYRIEGIVIFYQLMSPLCDISLSGIQEDKWILYYSKVDKLSNIYTYQIVFGGSYGHGFKPVKLPELFCHDVCIVRDSVWGGTSGTSYHRWQMSSGYDDGIAQGMNYRQ